MPEIVHAPARHLAAVEFSTDVAHIGEHLGEAYGAVEQYLAGAGTSPAGPAVAYYRNFTREGFDGAAGFEVATRIDGDGHVVPIDLPAGQVATETHLGPYDTLEHTYEALAAWAAREGHDLDLSTAWEEYWSPPGTPAEEVRTVIFVPVNS